MVDSQKADERIRLNLYIILTIYRANREAIHQLFLCWSIGVLVDDHYFLFKSFFPVKPRSLA
jgi:hypothetical protein